MIKIRLVDQFLQGSTYGPLKFLAFLAHLSTSQFEVVFVAQLTNERDEALLLVLGEALPAGAEIELFALVVRRHLGLALILEAAVEVV